ncbi:MAG: hypothetical protein ACP5KB_06175, partial [Thermoprotei archaeon]
MKFSRTKFRRGVSTLLFSTLVIVALLTSIAAVYMQLSALRHSMSSGAYSLMQYSELHDLTRLAVTQKENSLSVTNIGVLPVELQYVVIDDGYGVKIVSFSYLNCNCSGSSLQQGQTCYCLGLEGRVTALITSAGVVVRPEYVGVRSEKVGATYISLVPLESVYTPDDLRKLFNIPSELIDLPLTGGQGGRYAGMRGDKLLLITANDIRGDVEVVTGSKSGNVINVAPIGFGVMLIGYDPEWVRSPYGAPQYTIMLTIPKNVPQNTYLMIDGQKLSDYGSEDLRVIMRGFRGLIEIYNESGLLACTEGACSRSVLGGWFYGYN